jgi:alpha-galactosidase
VWPGYEFAAPALRHAWSATADRAFMHRRLWANDPDCVMLRTRDTDLTPAQVEGWARAVGASGGMVVVSDDLARLGPEHRALLDQVIAAGRAADARATDAAPVVPAPPVPAPPVPEGAPEA